MSGVEEMRARLEQATPDAPVSLGRYDVVGRLGRGGMGTVFDAIDRERRARVALKALFATDASGSVQLKREFRNVAELVHPNLAAVYELACDEGLWFFAMERIDGVSFRRWARREGSRAKLAAATPIEPPTRAEPGRTTALRDAESVPRIEIGVREATPPVRSMNEIRDAFAALVGGLGALHDTGLWHGDVKPANVLVRPDGRIAVVDFGLARPMTESAKPRGPTSGTPTYMSPEQLVGEEVGPSSDWYAVGTMLYEMLTGCLPFGDLGEGTLVSLYLKKTMQTPPSPRDLLPETAADLSEIAMRLLRPEAAARPGREELVAALSGEALPISSRTRALGRSQFVGREQELGELDRAYDRACSGRCVVVHASGASGIGKSATVRSFLGGVRDVDGTEVFRGRCFERETIPYKGFDGIVDELARRLIEIGPAIATMLPPWIGELAQAFPALAAVPGVAGAVIPAALEAKELRRRAWVAFRQLLEVMGRERAVALWIDDLQWADADSVGLLESLLREAPRMPLLVVVTCRELDASRREGLGSYFEVKAKLGAAGDAFDVPFGALSREEAALLARTKLEGLIQQPVSVERAQDLADESGGVPLFIEELARYVATTGRGGGRVSLEEAIAARVSGLPPDERALVEMASVAGSPIAQSLLFEAVNLEAGALSSLLALDRASLLSWNGPGAEDLVYVYHDRIRESVLAALGPDERGARHLALARTFAASGASVFEAVRHYGATAITDPAERLGAARLHVEAGRAARRAAAFPLAFACFEGGIALLARDAWTSEYGLALALHAGAAETAYLTASWSALDARAADVQRNGRSITDKLSAYEVQIDALIGRQEYVAAVDLAIHVLGLLGVKLPPEPAATDIELAVTGALAALQRIGVEAMEALPDVANPEAMAGMHLQTRLAPAAYFARPALLPMIAASLIKSSVEGGLSPATPYALAVFGIVLNTMGLFPTSHAWGQLAVKLIDRWEDRSLEAATRHIVFNLVCTWIVPLSTAVEPLRETFDIGRRSGDLEYASYAAHGYVHEAMYVGRPLEALVVEALDLGEQMRAFGQVNALHVHTPFEQLLKCWTGRTKDPSSLDDETFDERAFLAKAKADGSRSGIFMVHYTMALARFHFGRAAEASRYFEVARAHLDAVASAWHVPILHQHSVLAAGAAWDELSEEERASLRPKLDASLAALRGLAEHGPANFAHRAGMAHGELLRLDGDVNGAFARFVAAAEQAREGGWVSDLALARELASNCQPGAAAKRASLTAARDAYLAWGATAKVRQLDARIASLD